MSPRSHFSEFASRVLHLSPRTQHAALSNFPTVILVNRSSVKYQYVSEQVTILAQVITILAHLAARMATFLP